jgi:cobalt/nickel transport system permease protein
MDPRARLVVAVAFSVVVALSSRFQALAPSLIGAGGLVLSAGLPPGGVLRRLLVVNGLIVLLWFFLPFSVPGRALFSIGPLEGTAEGVLYAARITLKSNAIVLVLMALVSTMPIYTAGRAMRALGTPEKIVYLLFFTYRYVHVIFREYDRLSTAARIRGFRPRTSLHTYRTYAFLMGMLLVKSYERAQRVRAAMVCRGFRGRFYDLFELHWTVRDAGLSGLMLLFVLGVAILHWVP